MFHSPREANMLRLNAKHIEVLKPHILLMFATEQHSSNPLSVPLFPSKMALINGKKRSGSFILIRRWY